MSYALAGGLQAAVYQHLATDAGLATLIGDAVFDALPTGPLPETYVSIGEEEMRDRSDVSGAGAEHRLTVAVVSEAPGFAAAKDVAARIGDALLNGDVTLSEGRLVGLWLDRATARRTGSAGRVRRIDLRFRARVEDNRTI